MVALEELRPGLKDREAGQTIIRDVRVDVQEDSSGAQAIFVVLVLGDPPAGSDTWPIDDLLALRTLVRDLMASRDLPMPWYVTFEPEHPELLESEDDQLELDERDVDPSE